MIDLSRFRVLVFDLGSAKGHVETLEGRDDFVGGSGLAAMLYERFGLAGEPWDHPEQPFILTVGPLTGLFPLMSKTVTAFKSPYHDQYTESHAGGRSALAIRYAGFDAIVIKGRADRLSCLVVGPSVLRLRDASFLRGLDVLKTGKRVRSMFSQSRGHRSILRIGPAGEAGCSYACINADTYRHFGRMGGGAVWGSKNLKALVILGGSGPLIEADSGFRALFGQIYEMVTTKEMLKKYHDLGTPANLKKLNELKSLPWRNLQQTASAEIDSISGERFAKENLLRNMACSGCPVGCVHVGYVREKFKKDHRYFYRQVAYDYEPIFAVGTMLGVVNAADTLRIMDEVEKVGLDVMSTGVALAWATEALEKGVISRQETIEPLVFGDAEGYMRAVWHLGTGANRFYSLLAKGTMVAAREYGGEEFACVLGQEMAGYATGEVFFAAQSTSFRHSHLDCGGYSWDQQHEERDLDAALDFLIKDEQKRTILNSMVACLFSRSVYTPEMLAECLKSVKLPSIADNIEGLAERITRARWQVRFRTGYQPGSVEIPKRFFKIETWKGKIDADFLKRLKAAYAKRLKELYMEG